MIAAGTLISVLADDMLGCSIGGTGITTGTTPCFTSSFRRGMPPSRNPSIIGPNQGACAQPASLYPWQIWENGTLLGVFKTRREARSHWARPATRLAATRWWDRPAEEGLHDLRGNACNHQGHAPLEQSQVAFDGDQRDLQILAGDQLVLRLEKLLGEVGCNDGDDRTDHPADLVHLGLDQPELGVEMLAGNQAFLRASQGPCGSPAFAEKRPSAIR